MATLQTTVPQLTANELMIERANRRALSQSLQPLGDEHTCAAHRNQTLPRSHLQDTALLPVCEPHLSEHTRIKAWDPEGPFDECVCATRVVSADCWVCELHTMAQEKANAIAQRSVTMTDGTRRVRCACGDIVTHPVIPGHTWKEMARQCACCGNVVNLVFCNVEGHEVLFERWTETVLDRAPLPQAAQATTTGAAAVDNAAPAINRPGPAPRNHPAPPAPPSRSTDTTSSTSQTPTANAPPAQQMSAAQTRAKDIWDFAWLAMNQDVKAHPLNAGHTKRFTKHAVQNMPVEQGRPALREYFHAENKWEPASDRGWWDKLRKHERAHKADDAVISVYSHAEYMGLLEECGFSDENSWQAKIRYFVEKVWGEPVDSNEVFTVARLALRL